ncbi:PHP domain-containing protein [Nesterenkonia lutea]|uniref:Metal-dependent phosphoesterase TrpH n=1 Tax=Nesterenkonia lutea TaxID=272919 RepID=A0ABR9JF83_9MICC|nr:PHP domain-containing protein [Nesterenkonia lutea]MBE1524584.1 putative metal-dependent phosphoesterase TrpH [Nesterenkonia lutea]
MRVDLHTHSNVSDGTEAPAAVVAAAAAAGLQGLALTDHDTTAGWDEAIVAAVEHGIMLLPGMEITTLTENGISVHLLSYLHDPAHPGLSAAMSEARDGRLNRARRIAERLSVDFPLTWETVEQHVSVGATVGRPHLADALVGIGVVADRQEAFDHMLHAGSPYYVSQHNMHPTTAIRLVRAAGGVPVLAHGMASARGRTVSTEQLEEMVEAGLAGVEVHHRDNPESGRKVLRDLARAHDLLVTGSSDYHGTGKANLIGENTTDEQTVQALCELATGFEPIRP